MTTALSTSPLSPSDFSSNPPEDVYHPSIQLTKTTPDVVKQPASKHFLLLGLLTILFIVSLFYGFFMRGGELAQYTSQDLPNFIENSSINSRNAG